MLLLSSLWKDVAELFPVRICVLIFSLVFIFLFKEPLWSFIERLIKICFSVPGGPNVNLQTQVDIPPEDKSNDAYEQLLSSSNSPTSLVFEKQLIEVLDKLHITEPKKRVKILARGGANTMAKLKFTELAHGIYGSQVRLLDHINNSSEGCSINKAQEFYDTIKAPRSFFETYPFSAYLEWLKKCDLITESSGTLTITQAGTDFLTYITSRGIGVSYPRPG